MPRVYYEVTAAIRDEQTAAAYFDWMLGGHIRDVIAAGALTGRLVRLDADGCVFLAQYDFASRAALDLYLRDHAPRLREDGIRRFPSEKVTFTRRTGEILETS